MASINNTGTPSLSDSKMPPSSSKQAALPYANISDEDLAVIVHLCWNDPLAPQPVFDQLLAMDLAPSLQLGFAAFQDLFYTVCCTDWDDFIYPNHGGGKREEADLGPTPCCYVPPEPYASPLSKSVQERIGSALKEVLKLGDPSSIAEYEDDYFQGMDDDELSRDEILEEQDVDDIGTDSEEEDETNVSQRGHTDSVFSYPVPLPKSVAQVWMPNPYSPTTSPAAAAPAATTTNVTDTTVTATTSTIEGNADISAPLPEDHQIPTDDNEAIALMLMGDSSTELLVVEDSKTWPSVQGYRIIKWGFSACALYRSVMGHENLAAGLVGPILAAYLAHHLQRQPLDVRYNLGLFVYGLLGCLVAWCMPGYRGIAWVVPCGLAMVNPLSLLCRLQGWTCAGVMRRVRGGTHAVGRGCRAAGRALRRRVGLMYYPVFSAVYAGLLLLVVALFLTELAGLVTMIQKNNNTDNVEEIGQQGLQLSMFAVLIALVQSLKESFATNRKRREEGNDDEDDDDNEEVCTTTSDGISFVGLSLIVCAVLGAIAASTTTTTMTSRWNDDTPTTTVRRLVQGFAMICFGNAAAVQLGEWAPALAEWWY